MVNKLEEMCAIKVVANFCCQPQVKEKFLMINLRARINDTEFREDVLELKGILEQQFLDEIKYLPSPIRHDMPKHVIHFITIEMIDWMIFQFQWFGLCPSYCLSIFKSSHFTHEGTLDKVLIARDIVQDERLNVLQRIVIALGYCQIDNVSLLWKKMDENEKQCTYQKKLKYFNFRDHLYWERYPWNKILSLAIINDKCDKYLPDVCKNSFNAFEEVAFKNSWMRLSSVEKEYVSEKEIGVFFHSTSKWKCYYDDKAFVLNRYLVKMLRFWIYNVNEEVLNIILIKFTHLSVLKLLLFWPNQDMFVKVLNIVWEEITPIDFYELLHSIVDMIEDDEISNTYNYRSILEEVWSRAPSVHKKYVGCMESETIRPLYSTLKYSSFAFTKEGRKFKHYYREEGDSLLKFLITRLFCLKTFTNADVIFMERIASDVTARAKENIFGMQGQNIFDEAEISGRLGIPDLFMECFGDEETISGYKEMKRTFLVEGVTTH